ncbi:Glu-tRNA(Gln) amidotransferase subunit GatD [Candidatus Woesearchaeota archaeon]|nr:Glu-tRNA(Gln) amidotransferase subunit GatD [Candidatus Woesearchaeota archaeon]
MIREGDKVQIKTAKEVIEGMLMPSHEADVVIIKLANGYNIGIDKNKIKEMKVMEKHKEKEHKTKEIKEKKGLPTIMILGTGGTIASKVDYSTGGVIAKFTPGDLLELMPELGEIANIKTELVANMMSEDMMFSDYQKIAATIKKYADKVDGVIIGHGTDTLAYTAAALSFMFEKINIPAILVGSQRSTDRGSSDGSINLICAAEFIAKSNFAGVALCMHNASEDNQCAILPATKTRKMHTSRRDAFKVINDKPIALVGYKTKKIEFLKKDYQKKSKDKIVLKDKFEEDVALVKTHTNMKSSLFEFLAKNYKAIVFETTGLGHMPTNLGKENLKNYEILKKFIKKGGMVAITSQCLFGRVHPSVYSNLRRLSEIGCVFCEDMLPETAFIKLSWLFGNDKKDAKRLLTENLRGEINKRIEFEEDFLE